MGSRTFWFGWPLRLAGFGLLVGWALWPLPLHIDSALPTGDSALGTVPMLNAWIMWWNADRLFHGLADYWNAPIFHPTPGALAFSEPLPMSMLLSPVTRYASPVVSYNIYLSLAMLSNGLLAYRLVRHHSRSPGAGWAAGIGMTLHPLAIQNLEAIQLVALGGILWTMDAWLRFCKRPSWRGGCLVGCGLGLTALLSLHHALFFGLVFAGCGWITFPFGAIRRAWPGLLTGGLVAAALSGPTVWCSQQIHAQHDFTRNPQTVLALSAEANDWITSQATTWIPTNQQQPGDFPLSPGILRVTLAVLGLPLCLSRKRQLHRLLASMAIVSSLLAFGPNMSVGSWTPWETLAEWLPPIARVRSPYRFAYLTQLAVVLLACVVSGQAVRAWSLRNRAQSAPDAKRFGRAIQVVGCLVLALVAFEVWPARTQLFFPPLPRHGEQWVDYVRSQIQPDRAIVCLPVADNMSEQSQQQETIWMMYGTQHGARLLNGYSGFVPAQWQRLRRRLRDEPLSDDTLDMLVARDTQLLVVRKDRLRPQTTLVRARESARLSLLFEDEQYAVFELFP